MNKQEDLVFHQLFKQLDDNLQKMPAQFGNLMIAIENLKDSWFLVSQIYRELKRQKED